MIRDCKDDLLLGDAEDLPLEAKVVRRPPDLDRPLEDRDLRFPLAAGEIPMKEKTDLRMVLRRAGGVCL